MKIKLPLRYDSESQFVLDAENKIILEIMGWGWIKDKSDPEKFQDAMAAEIVRVLNENMIRSVFTE